jgi:dihydroorotate dehydrogenase (fumarate)
MPVIASLNGINQGGWVEIARQIEQAGADALELNLYYLPTSINLRSEDLENEQLTLVRQLREKINIPLAVKLSPYYSALPSFCARLAEAGANGFVLFNRFYQPDLDIETLEVKPSLELSTTADLKLPVRWVAILFGKVEGDLALSSGVHCGVDAVKAIMAGAAAVMSASELIEKGIPRAAEMLSELETWMEAHEYDSIRQMRGSLSQRSVAEPGAFERANYMKALTLYDNRV